MHASKDDDLKAVQFGDDESYMRWCRENPAQFALTTNKSLTPRHTVIHQANGANRVR